MIYDYIIIGGGISGLYLFYKLKNSTLFIRRYDQRQKSEKEFEFPVENNNESDEIILEKFLINLMSYRQNFAGELAVWINGFLFFPLKYPRCIWMK